MLHIGGENLNTILRFTGNFLAGCAKIEQRQIHQRQAKRSDQTGNHRIAGDQFTVGYAMVTNRGGNHDAEHQRTEGIHGQVALQKTLHKGRALIIRRNLADRPCGNQQRRAAQNQQRRQQHRGDVLADAVNQLPRIERQKQHGGKVGQGVEQQGRTAIATERRDAHLERHHRSAWRGKQRADSQVNRYRK